MACTLLSITAADCAITDGGIYTSYATDRANISAVTFDTDGQITAFTMATTGKWTLFEMDTESETAFYNEEGTRVGNKHDFKQTAFMRFPGLDNPKRKAAKAIVSCCDLVVVHFLNNGTAKVQGVEQIGTSTSANRSTKKKCKATVKLMSDTGANEDRMELEFISEGRIPSHFTTLSAANLAAL